MFTLYITLIWRGKWNFRIDIQTYWSIHCSCSRSFFVCKSTFFFFKMTNFSFQFFSYRFSTYFYVFRFWIFRCDHYNMNLLILVTNCFYLVVYDGSICGMTCTIFAFFFSLVNLWLSLLASITCILDEVFSFIAMFNARKFSFLFDSFFCSTTNWIR